MHHLGFQKIKIDGKEVEEGYVLNKWMASRFDRNKNVLGVYVGQTGSGKTYSLLSQMESYYKFRFNKPFPKENICFSLDATVKRLRFGKLKKGEFLVVEEAGVLMGNLDFQNKIAKFFGYILQSFRSKNIGVMFTLPDLSMLNKTARRLLHIILLTTGIDVNTNEVVLKPFYVQTNALSGKDYRKYLRQKIGNRYIKIERIRIGLPSAELIKVYEEMKNNFVNKVEEDFLDVVEPKKKDNEKENPIWKPIKELWEQGITSAIGISKIIDLNPNSVGSHLRLMMEKGIIKPKYEEKAKIYLENKQKLSQKPIVVPTTS